MALSTPKGFRAVTAWEPNSNYDESKKVYVVAKKGKVQLLTSFEWRKQDDEQEVTKRR